MYPESKDDEATKAIEEEQRDHAEAKKLNVRLIKQTIDDACGMFAMINGVLNSDARNDVGKYWLHFAHLYMLILMRLIGIRTVPGSILDKHYILTS